MLSLDFSITAKTKNKQMQTMTCLHHKNVTFLFCICSLSFYQSFIYTFKRWTNTITEPNVQYKNAEEIKGGKSDKSVISDVQI